MTQQEILNAMLEKQIKRANKPKWRINLEATILIFAYLALFPGILITLFWTGHWIFGILWAIPTFLGLGTAFGGRKFALWLMQKVMWLKIR